MASLLRVRDLKIWEDEGSLHSRVMLTLAWFAGACGGAAFTQLDAVLGAAAFAFVVSYVPIVRRRGGTYSAECAPGDVFIVGHVRERIRSSDILGASFVMVDQRPTEVLLSLRRRRGVMRIVGSCADIEALAKSWNLPARGMGEVDLTLAPRPLDYLSFGLRVVAALGLVALIIARPVYGSVFVGFMFGLPLAILAALVASWLVHTTVRPTLSLSPEALAVRTSYQRQSVARETTNSARVDGRMIDVTRNGAPLLRIEFMRSRLLGVGLSRDLAEGIAATLATQPTVEASITPLARGGDSIRSWLTRLDRLGDTASDAYRNQAPAAAELWRVLESPDYEAELRAAAARILRRRAPEELRVRIAPVLDSIGDAEIRRRVEVVAWSDVDGVDEDASVIPRSVHVSPAQR